VSLEATLAAVLQAEVDKRVAAVQAAADAAVEAFRKLAESLSRGQAVTHQELPSPHQAVTVESGKGIPLNPPPAPPEDGVPTMQSILDAISAKTISDPEAAAANMAVR
jgi:hypothetical protein